MDQHNIVTRFHFKIIQYSDVRNGWPYDYHNAFWENYYRKYGTQNCDYDFSIEYPFPTGPRCNRHPTNSKLFPLIRIY